ncbi:hypothetical protein MHYP_G00231310 [Metynnis hypsauchen]
MCSILYLKHQPAEERLRLGYNTAAAWQELETKLYETRHLTTRHTANEAMKQDQGKLPASPQLGPPLHIRHVRVVKGSVELSLLK